MTIDLGAVADGIEGCVRSLPQQHEAEEPCKACLRGDIMAYVVLIRAAAQLPKDFESRHAQRVSR